MFFSLLKTISLIFPLGLGGLNIGDSQVQDSDYNDLGNRSNNIIATQNNDFDFNYNVVQNSTPYVLKSQELSELFDNIPDYVNFEPYTYGGVTYYSTYSFAFDFYTLNESNEKFYFNGLILFKFDNYYEVRYFTNTLYSFASSDDYVIFARYYLSGENVGYNRYVYFDSIFVDNSNIVGSYHLDNSRLDLHDKKGIWSVFNCFYQTGLDYYDLEEDFNYNGLMHTSRNSFYVQHGNFSLSTNLTIIKDIYSDYFFCNGYLFSRAYIMYLNVHNRYVDDGSGVVHFNTDNQIPMGFYFCTSFVPAVLSDFNGSEVEVHWRDKIIGNPSSTNWYLIYQNSTSWIKPNFRHLEFLNDTDLNADSLISLNTQYNLTYGGGGYSAVGLSDSFSLMSSAFGGFVSLFAIQLIPGLSLGILIFLPLIITLVVLVFKAVKK